jgi:hypothetical protein
MVAASSVIGSFAVAKAPPTGGVFVTLRAPLFIHGLAP